jgi:hypothetical protein
VRKSAVTDASQLHAQLAARGDEEADFFGCRGYNPIRATNKTPLEDRGTALNLTSDDCRKT